MASIFLTIFAFRPPRLSPNSFTAISDPYIPVYVMMPVLDTAWYANIAVAGENALTCYHRGGYNKIFPSRWDPSGRNHLSCFTYLRLCPTLLEESNLKEF